MNKKIDAINLEYEVIIKSIPDPTYLIEGNCLGLILPIGFELNCKPIKILLDKDNNWIIKIYNLKTEEWETKASLSATIIYH